MKINQFAKEWMGKSVAASHKFLRVEVRDGPRLITKWVAIDVHPELRGWVVGVRWLQEGYHVFGNNYDEGDHFKETGPRTFCVLLATYPSKKPLPVPIEGLTLIE